MLGALVLFALVAGQAAQTSPPPDLARLGPQTGQPSSSGGSPAFDTPHLTLRTAISDRTAAPGTRISLLLDITPKPRMHVYAPEQKDLIPVTVVLEPNAALKLHPTKFPASETYFAALNETQHVYSKPFRIVQDVTIALTPAMRERATRKERVTITGKLRYQACDDKVCFLPQDVPVAWTIELRPIER
jgi:DsbC/DsbD-like thiol-disulfide interchange protein